jgi:aldehyde dehydrogenase (NAD(P)+)
MTHNASFTCCAPRVLVLPKGWAQRGAFLDAVACTLGAAPARTPCDPEARERWHSAVEGRADLRLIGSEARDDALAWALVCGLDAESRAEVAFRAEQFCPVLFETAVGGDDPVRFAVEAVRFANERLWGTLAATLIVHPALMKDVETNAAVERAIAELRYGAVGVNGWPGLLFALGTPPWGAHPSSTPHDIQSGRGWTHNTWMLEGIEKVVLRRPIAARWKPSYFITHRTAHDLLRRLTVAEETGSWSKVPGVIRAAMRA